MAVASPQVELLISLFFSEDDVNFSYVSYISTSGITTLDTQDIFLDKIKNHANNLIGDHIVSAVLEGASKDLNKKLPNIDSISRVVHRSRAKSSGSTNSESSDAKLFVFPPNCLTTANNDNFSTTSTRNLSTLADYPNWIGDGRFYILYPGPCGN